MTHDADPRASSLEELQQLFLDSTSIDDFLDELVNRAAAGLAPVTTSCGLTLRRSGLPFTVASSDALARGADEIQYGQGEGPCLEALQQGRAVVVNDLTQDERWPLYRKQALAQGVRASLSTPVKVLGHAVGALNLYRTAPHDFTAVERTRMVRYSSEIGGVVGIAIRFADQAEMASHLRAALASRTVIDQAMGVIMGQNRCSADAAFALLRNASQNRNIKLRDVAAGIIETVTGSPPAPSPSFT